MLVEVGVSNAVDVIGPVREHVAAERHVPLLITPVAMGTKLMVAPAVVEIAMTVVSIMVPVPIMVSIMPVMTPIVLIETVTIILVELLPAADRGVFVFVYSREMLKFLTSPAGRVFELRCGRGYRALAARSAAASAFSRRGKPVVALG